MEESTPKEKILKRIRQALLYKSANPYAHIDLDSGVFAPDSRETAIAFADSFTQAGGQLVYCENHFDYIDNLILVLEEKEIKKAWCGEPALRAEFDDIGLEFTHNPEILDQADVVVTSCEALLARTGSILLSSRKNGRLPAAVAPVHLVKAFTSQLVPDMKQSLQLLRNKYGNNLPSLLCYASGPSRTADIERTLVMGAQGPREVFLFLVDDTRTENE